MKKKNVLKVSIIIVFLVLGFYVYKICNDNYLFKVNYYNDTVEYFEKHPEELEEYEGLYGKLMEPTKSSATELYGMVLENSFISFAQFLYPILIVMISTYSFYKILHSGFIRNISFRKLYSKYMKSNILKMWFKAIVTFIIPHIFIFMVCLFYSEFKLFDSNSIYISKTFNNNVWLFLSFFVYLLFYAIFCCNLGLIFIKKQRKYIIDLILVEIVYIVLVIFLETGLGTVIYNLGLQYNNGKLLSMVTGTPVLSLFPYYYLNIESLHWATMLLMFIAMVYTTFWVYLLYSNKESVMIESEN